MRSTLDCSILEAMGKRPAIFAIFGALAFGSLGCTEVGSYATDADEVYVGEVFGSDEAESFIRRGFEEGVVLEMSFDPDAAQTGVLNTTNDPCGVLVDAPMRGIPALQHDQLFLYEFPGGGQLRNYIYSIDATTGPLAGRDAMAFVSLQEDGELEVRVIAGSGQEPCAACAIPGVGGPCDYFGVFRVKRRDISP